MSHKTLCILVDMDNTLVDFDRAVASAMASRYPEVSWQKDRDEFECPSEHESYFRSIVAEEGFFLNLQPLPGAIEAMHELRNQGHEVWICTAPLKQYTFCVTEKFAWVDKHLGPEWVKRIIIAKDKTLVRGDLLVDDKPQTGSMKPTWEQVFFDQPYNRRESGKRFSCWLDFVKMTQNA